MKQLIILITIIMTTSIAHSQGLSNIFNQKAADIKSMIKQIGLLQIYIGWIQKGYSIARSGLNIIGEIKQGDFSIHHTFFSSLSSVNPAIQRCARVASIIDRVQMISKELDKIQFIKYLSKPEMDYLLSVKQNLLAGCSHSLDLLQEVVTGSDFQMSDGERLAKVDQIYADVMNKSVFAKECTQDATLISSQRQWDLTDLKSLHNLE